MSKFDKDNPQYPMKKWSWMWPFRQNIGEVQCFDIVANPPTKINLSEDVTSRNDLINLSEDVTYYPKDKNDQNRRVFYIDVGNVKPEDIDDYMKTMIESMKKTPFIDPKTGEYNLSQISGSLWTEEWFFPNRPKKEFTDEDLKYTIQPMKDEYFL